MRTVGRGALEGRSWGQEGRSFFLCTMTIITGRLKLLVLFAWPSGTLTAASMNHCLFLPTTLSWLSRGEGRWQEWAPELRALWLWLWNARWLIDRPAHACWGSLALEYATVCVRILSLSSDSLVNVPKQKGDCAEGGGLVDSLLFIF